MQTPLICLTVILWFGLRLKLERGASPASSVQSLKRTWSLALADISSECEPISCDFCRVKKLRAVKFCLTCTALYCEAHVTQHYTVPALQSHRLVETTEHLEQMICQQHRRSLEMFCRTDRVSICSLCAVLKHKHHDITIEYLEQVCVQRS